MYTVSAAIERFLGRITLTDAKVETAARRAATIQNLAQRRLNVLEVFPTGSLVRGTALRGQSDLDVFLVLHHGEHARDRTPTEFLNEVRVALSGYNARLVRRNGQAVSLYFQTWPNVDVVPAVRVVDEGRFRYHDIPDMNRDAWISTNPASHTQQVLALPSHGVDRVRMFKAWNHAHGGYFQSYHLEVFALRAPPVTGDRPWDLFRMFDSALESFDELIWDASGRAFVDDYLRGDNRSEARKRLETARDLACDAWHMTYGPRNEHRQAIEVLRRVFPRDFPNYG